MEQADQDALPDLLKWLGRAAIDPSVTTGARDPRDPAAQAKDALCTFTSRLALFHAKCMKAALAELLATVKRATNDDFDEQTRAHARFMKFANAAQGATGIKGTRSFARDQIIPKDVWSRSRCCVTGMPLEHVKVSAKIVRAVQPRGLLEVQSRKARSTAKFILSTPTGTLWAISYITLLTFQRDIEQSILATPPNPDAAERHAMWLLLPETQALIGQFTTLVPSMVDHLSAAHGVKW